MKIIDLLNKIVNREEVPDKVKWEDLIYYYSKLNKNYYTVLTGDGGGIGCTLLNDMSYDIDNLNDEVEIIEEDKEIEKIKTLNNVGNSTCFSEFSDKQHLNNHLLKDKINELIDKVNSLEKRGD